MTDLKKSGVAFWATVVVVCLPVLYVLSFGPACWLSRPPAPVEEAGYPQYPIDIDDDFDLSSRAPRVFWPIGWLSWHGPRMLCHAIGWYATIGRPPEYIYVPVDPAAATWMRF